MIVTSLAKTKFWMRNQCRTLSGTEWFFLLLAIPLGFGFVRIGVDFAKIGIPLSLPPEWGGIKNLNTSIFLTEIFIFCLFFWLLATGQWRTARKGFEKILLERNAFVGAILLLLGIGFFRALPDLKENPILVIRNSAFVWYLIISLLIFSLNIRPKILNQYFYLMIGIGFFFFTRSVLRNFSEARHVSDWVPVVGVYGPFVLGLVYGKLMVSLPILFFLGLGLGVDSAEYFQRTSLLGMSLAAAGALFLFRRRIKVMFFRLLFLFLMIGVGHIAYVSGRISGGDPFSWWDFTHRESRYEPSQASERVGSGTLQKAQVNAKGMESFRWDMWMDALGLFYHNPSFGIGFAKQVVYRVVGGYYGEYGTNDSVDWGHPSAPPISGPHNSYLNALVRLGIWGIILPLMHIFAFFVLLRERYWGGLFMVFGQGLYAMFNVGLEGPTRSLFLLLAIGLALKLELERKKA